MLALLLATLLNALSALVMGDGVRRVAALLISAGALPVVLLLPPENPTLRAWVCMGSGFLFLRMLDVHAERARGPLYRLALTFAIIDLRTWRAAPPGLDVGLLMRTLGFGAATVAAWLLADGAPAPGRWLAGAVFFYAGMDAASGAMNLLIGLAGATSRPMQDAPIRSRTIAELWGQRWNQEVGGLLHRHVFRPLVRRGRTRLGLFAAFVASGLLHAVPTLVAVGWREAVWIQVFFVLQGVALLIERWLGVRAWRPAAGHAWVIGVFAVTVPFFVEPALAVMGLG